MQFVSIKGADELLVHKHTAFTSDFQPEEASNKNNV